MTSPFDFDAPQYMNLRENAYSDDFFSIEAKDEFIVMPSEASLGKDGCGAIRRITRVSFAADKENSNAGEKYSLGDRVKTPKSMKTELINDEDQNKLLEGIQSLQIDSGNNQVRKPLRTTQVFEGIQLLPASEKKHRMTTRADSLLRTPQLKLRSRSIPRVSNESDEDTDDTMVSAVSSSSVSSAKTGQQLEPSSYGYGKRNSDHFHPNDPFSKQKPHKFVALAEQVANFQKDTPDRFRTKPHHPWRPTRFNPKVAMPLGPKLATLHRTRPIHFPDRNQREQQEYEEMLKHQIKAHPVNARILKQVCLGLKAPIEKRPSTAILPFKLTQYQKPQPVEDAPAFVFKAQPVPRKILQSPVGIPPKKTIPATTPKTPAITAPVRVKVPSLHNLGGSSSYGSCESLPRNTIVEPFSFDGRDRCMRTMKEEHIKKILEEEKKTFSAFKAQPIRNISATPLLRHVPVKGKTTPRPFNLTQSKTALNNPAGPMVEGTPFRAKPALVLHKRPFFPTHAEHAPPMVKAFELKTEVRAVQRKEFDAMLQKKEEEAQKMMLQAQKEEEQRIAAEVKKLRVIAEFTARPVPKGKPFEVHESKMALTQPRSPNFQSGQRIEKPNPL